MAGFGWRTEVLVVLTSGGRSLSPFRGQRPSGLAPLPPLQVPSGEAPRAQRKPFGARDGLGLEDLDSEEDEKCPVKGVLCAGGAGRDTLEGSEECKPTRSQSGNARGVRV